MDVFGYHIPSLAVVAAAFSSVYAAFAKFDADQSDKNRQFVRQWLLGLKVDDGQWAQFFQELFSKAFGAKHLSLKCMGRSALLSAGILAAIWIPWLLHGTNGRFEERAYIPVVLGYVVFIGMAVDYLSLWKTRILLTKARLLGNGLSALAVIVGDAIATRALTVATFLSPEPVLVENSKFTELIYEWTFSWPHLPEIHDLIWGPPPGTRIDYFDLALLAPLFTSAWRWVYLLVAYATRREPRACISQSTLEGSGLRSTSGSDHRLCGGHGKCSCCGNHHAGLIAELGTNRFSYLPGCARLGEPDVGAAFVQHQPALGDRKV
jgi:hypothetical protein